MWFKNKTVHKTTWIGKKLEINIVLTKASSYSYWWKGVAESAWWHDIMKVIPKGHTFILNHPIHVGGGAYSIWHRNTAPHCNFLRKEPGPSPGGRFLLAPLGAQSRRQFLSSSAGPSPGDIIPAGLEALLSIEAGANVLKLFWKFARVTMQWFYPFSFSRVVVRHIVDV